MFESPISRMPMIALESVPLVLPPPIPDPPSTPALLSLRALTRLPMIRIVVIVELPLHEQAVPMPDPKRDDEDLENAVARTVEFHIKISSMDELPNSQSPVPIADPRCGFCVSATALTLEFQITRNLSPETPPVFPPVPIPDPVAGVDATITLFTIVKFSTTDVPEVTIPAPRPAPVVPGGLNEAAASTIPPRTTKLPTYVAFPDPAGPAPIPVPPLEEIDPFTNSIVAHCPLAAVPIPDPSFPASTVNEPLSTDANVTFENSPHSTPVEDAPSFFNEFSPSKTTVTELSQIENGDKPVS
jgi:hypothetical protein